MDTPVPTKDPWRWPTLGLWTLFFAAGLLPNETFDGLRVLSGVVTARAAINSPWVLPLAQAAFLFYFFHEACRRAGIDPDQSGAKALQTAIVALVAFLPMELSQILEMQYNPVPQLRLLYFGAALVKGIAWLYLFTLAIRYHLKGDQVLRALWVFFPSARYPQT